MEDNKSIISNIRWAALFVCRNDILQYIFVRTVLNWCKRAAAGTRFRAFVSAVCKDLTINDKTGHIVLVFIYSRGKSISGLGQEQMA